MTDEMNDDIVKQEIAVASVWQFRTQYHHPFSRKTHFTFIKIRLKILWHVYEYRNGGCYLLTAVSACEDFVIFIGSIEINFCLSGDPWCCNGLTCLMFYHTLESRRSSTYQVKPVYPPLSTFKPRISEWIKYSIRGSGPRLTMNVLYYILPYTYLTY